MRTALAVLALSCLASNSTHAQLLIWSDEVPGGVITGGFTLGTSTFGTGSFEMPVPTGSTIQKALFYATRADGSGDATTVSLNDQDYVFGPANQGPGYNSAYGGTSLHTIDVTDDLDPTVTNYTIRISPSAPSNGFREFYLLIAYAQPGADPVWCDVYFSTANSALSINYTLNTSRPMLTAGGIAFASVVGYALDYWQDCEEVSVNGTPLGHLYGGDFNAASPWGASGSFFYSNDAFLGLGDDTVDLAIDGGDALSDISSLVTDGATSITVQYDHCPIGSVTSQQDNHVWLMVLAYTTDPCSQVFSLGPDTTLCAGATLQLDAAMLEGDHVWQDGSTAAAYSVTAAGTYHVTITDGACQWTDTIEVTMQPLSFYLGGDIILCMGDQIQLDAYSGAEATYVWQDGTTDPTLTVSSAGVYRVTASLGNCSITDSVRVTMDSCLFEVEVPNIFTPNGDATNSTFQPTLVGVSAVSLYIYNRWGQLIYTSSALQPVWDGRTDSGMPVPDGTYFYVLGYTRNGAQGPEELHGAVTLLR